MTAQALELWRWYMLKGREHREQAERARYLGLISVFRDHAGAAESAYWSARFLRDLAFNH